jgi:hypothetical protein
MTTKIQVRSQACRCGCHGQDPWHKANFNRAVRNVVDVPAVPNDSDSAEKVVVARGVASFPWGEEAVVATVWSFGGKLLKSRPDWQLETLKR